MGLFNSLLGNASMVNLEELQTEYANILIDGEQLENAFRIFRDKWVFTNKRLIMEDVQGVTGKKRDYHSIPSGSITHFSVETAGTFDDDCEMKLWVKGIPHPLTKEFKHDTDILGIQRALAKHIL